MESKETPDKGNPTLRIGIRVLIIAIILIVLFILSLAIIKLVPKALDGIESLKDSLSSSTSTKQEVISVSPDRTVVVPGQELTVSWTNTNVQNQNGYYAFKYDCQSGAAFETIQNGMPIACNTDFPLSASSTNSQVMYSSTGQEAATFRVGTSSNTAASSSDVVFEIDYVNPSTGGVYASGSSMVTVETAQNAAATSTITVSPAPAASSTEVTTVTSVPAPAAPVRSTYVGPADFQVKILSTGIINPQTNHFEAASSFSSDEKIAVQFQISNIGGQPTGAWNFNASLPSSIANEANYVSPTQASLQPGSSVLYTLGFDPSSYSSNAPQPITISVLPSLSLSETNTSNNTASVSIIVSGGTATSPYYPTSGESDLAISSAQAGYVSSNGQFIESSNIPYGSNAAVNLSVINQGGQASGEWSFSANVEGSSGYQYGNYNNASYNSGDLQSLQPGATQSFIINVSQLSQGQNSLLITVDPNDQTQDANRSNNTATVQIYTNNYNY
jgi:hypothetical protein